MALSDKELLEGCLRNDSACQEALYNKYSAKMLGLCMRYAKDVAEAEDIFQEAFIKVFNNLSKFRGDSQLSTWIRSIMVNTALKAIRTRNRRPEDYKEEEIHVPVDPVMPLESDEDITEKELLNIIADLPEGYKIVFMMYHVEGYSHKEIAKHLKISENTSKSQLSRARKQLQGLVTKKLNEKKRSI